jgi:hypothetical protein
MHTPSFLFFSVGLSPAYKFPLAGVFLLKDSPAMRKAAQASNCNPVSTQTSARFDRTDWLSFAATAALALGLYSFTLPPEVTLGMSGTMATGAMYAGVPSPPGYPVWTIYSWLIVKLIPFSNVAWRVALGSAIASALAAGLVALMVSYAARMIFGATPMYARLGAAEQKWLRAICGYAAGMILGFSSAVWGGAVLADFWALSLLLFTGALCLVTRWLFEPLRKGFVCAAFLLFGWLLTSSQELLVALPGLMCAVMFAEPEFGRDLCLIVTPLAVFGTSANQYHVWPHQLSTMNWPLLLGFTGAGSGAAAIAIGTRRLGTEWKPALLCGLCLLLGLAFYFYPPIASMTVPPVNWAYARTTEGFFHLIGRGQYEAIQPTDAVGKFATQLCAFGRATGKGFGWPYLPFLLPPFGFFLRLSRIGRRWMGGLVVIAVCLGPLLLAMLNPDANLQRLKIGEPYFAPMFVVLALWTGTGMMILAMVVTAKGRRQL